MAGRGVAAGRAQIVPNGTVIQVVTISTQDASAVLSRVRAVLHRETKAPVRWPSFIPTATSVEHPLYVNLISEDSDSYNMELGTSPDCIGGGYCHYGSVRASAGSQPDAGRAQVEVKLRDGITGYFMESSTCGARCDDATIAWSEKGYHFLISVKAEKKQTLVRVANSAIASAHAPARQDGERLGPEASLR
jgi:hypothetical protein